MTKKKMPILHPVEVQAVYPVTSMVGATQRLDGCSFKVVYDGIADVNKRTLSRMGLFSGGYGSGHQNLETEGKLGGPHTTTLEYVFKEGLFYPEPFARANKFHDALNKAKTDFVPMNVYAVSAEYKYDLFGDSYVRGYRLEVYYPKSALNNPLFKKFITHGKPKVIGVRADGFDKNVIVTYRFRDKDDVTKAYEAAMAFKTYVLGQMKSNEDTK